MSQPYFNLLRQSKWNHASVIHNACECVWNQDTEVVLVSKQISLPKTILFFDHSVLWFSFEIFPWHDYEPYAWWAVSFSPLNTCEIIYWTIKSVFRPQPGSISCTSAVVIGTIGKWGNTTSQVKWPQNISTNCYPAPCKRNITAWAAWRLYIILELWGRE